jgi:DNA-binding response OmpR family regulator
MFDIPSSLPDNFHVDNFWPIDVLVLDDEPAVLASFDYVLARKVNSYELALQGEEGLRLMEKTDFDLVFCDVLLRDGMRGFDLLKEAKGKHPDIEFVMIPVSPSEKDRKKAIEQGALTILGKPFVMEEVYPLIERVFKIREKKGLIKKPEPMPPIEDFIKDGKFTFGVVGIGYENREENIKYAKEGDSVILRREPNNPHDKNAIRVLTRSGKELGYVPREFAEQIAPKMKNEIEAVLITVDTP